MSRVISQVAVALAMLLVGSASLARQEEVIVRPGGGVLGKGKGGQGPKTTPWPLEWTVGGRSAVVGSRFLVRDDLRGKIEYFWIYDEDENKHDADWVEFTVLSADGKSRKVRIERDEDEFKWVHKPRRWMSSCKHKDTCEGDGITKFMMESVLEAGGISGQYTENGKAVPVDVVSKIQMRGKAAP